MSFIAEIESKVHTFAAWSSGELKKLVAAEPTIAHTADTVLQYAGGAASIIAGIEGGPAASALVQKFISTVQTGAIALNGLITDFGANPTTASVAASLASNASNLLAAAKVTNPTSVAAGTAIIDNLTTLATALATAVPPAGTPAGQ